MKGLNLDFGVTIKVVQISKHELMWEKRQESIKASTVIHISCVSAFRQSVVEEQSIHEQTVSLGSMPYSCLFNRDTVEVKVGPAGWWWMEIQISHYKQHHWTNSVVGVIVSKQEVCHLHAADLHTANRQLSEIIPPVKSCHIHRDKTVAWLLLVASSQVIDWSPPKP